MSEGTFVYTNYERNDGAIQRIRVQPETLGLTIDAVANAAPAGPRDTAGTVRVGSSRRSFGVTARRVAVRWTGAVPDGYDPNGIIYLPILTPGLFNDIILGATGTYLGNSIEVVGTTPEQVR